MTAVATPAAVLAAAIRRHREANRLSLGELGRRTGLSKTSLSRLESGDGNPSLETLWRIARAMDLTIGELLAWGDDGPRLRRAGEGPLVESASGMRARLLHSDDSRHRTEVFELDLAPGAGFDADPHAAGTEELVVCLAGTVVCGPPGERMELGPGDSAWYDGAAPHRYGAGPDGGRAVLVMSYPMRRAT